MKSLIILIVFVCVLFGVGIWNEVRSHSVKSGIVISKDHSDAWVQTSTIIISDGKTTTMIPQTTYWPETWTVTIRGTNSSGKILSRHLRVSECEFDKITEGQTLNAK